MPDSFPVYKAEQLRKVNSLRRANSLVQIDDVPILDKGQVQFVTAEEVNNEPCSCYNCEFYNAGSTCYFFGPSIAVRKFIFPAEPTADSKPIEYWPVCGAQHHGKPNKGREQFADTLSDPDNLGLGWVNAPRIGLTLGGANCGGSNGGDDCDYYDVEGTDDKRKAPTGTCRILKVPVANADVCACWMDDDFVDWRKGIQIIKELGLV